MFANLYLLLLVILTFNLVKAFVFNKTKLEDIRKRLVEGDILINDKFHGLRNGLRDLSKRWPSAKVYYLFSSLDEFYPQEKSIIRQAMNEIEMHSCLRFIELSQTEIFTEDFLVITSNYECFSSIGRQTGPQELSLQSPICINKGTIVHELMHAIGFIHEQSRPDRDEYVQIMWDNIDKQKHINFQIYNDVIDLKNGYDFESIMHYEFNAFAKSKELTSIKPLDSSIPLSLLGSAKKSGTLTQSDIKMLNKYYEC